jgi:hypothetical protein
LTALNLLRHCHEGTNEEVEMGRLWAIVIVLLVVLVVGLIIRLTLALLVAVAIVALVLAIYARLSRIFKQRD